MRKAVTLAELLIIAFFLFSTAVFADSTQVTTKTTTQTITSTITASNKVNRDIVTDQNRAIKGVNTIVSDTYTGRDQKTTVKGESTFGKVDIKNVKNGSATVTFGNFGINKGYTDNVKKNTEETKDIRETIKNEKDTGIIKDKKDVEIEWFESIISGAVGDKVMQKLKNSMTTQEELIIRGTGTVETIINVSINTTKKYTGRGNQIRKHVKDYFVEWVFKNNTTGKTETYRKTTNPMDVITWTFNEVGEYTITSTPFSKWDVGHYEYYDVMLGNKKIRTESKWVHERYVDDWYMNARRTYNLTISVEELGKTVVIPNPNGKDNKKVEPIAELVK